MNQLQKNQMIKNPETEDNPTSRYFGSSQLVYKTIFRNASFNGIVFSTGDYLDVNWIISFIDSSDFENPSSRNFGLESWDGKLHAIN